MRASPLTLSFALLALCGHGLAGPCKPKTTSTAEGPSSTQETTSASTAVSTTVEESSTVESFTSYSSSIISDTVSSIVTTTSDAPLSSSTELSASFETTDTSVTITSTTELSTTSNTVETTTSDTPISTTTEQPAPSNILLNPSFDEPNQNGQVDGSPWNLQWQTSASLSINPNVARTGSHSAYWSFPANSDRSGGEINQRVSFESGHVYKLSYWWYIDETVQPQGLEDCQLTTSQRHPDGRVTYYSDDLKLSSFLPLQTWIKREFQLNAESLSAADLSFTPYCFTNTGTGFKLAIDDVQLFY
ncbi:hypothetical protein NW768_010972 [Fusarium equiseti]|uniref:CBM-cenC domain-containing protein n=1 Tax=Fusarium equiseti TaxID=61235 RepID=A0ABQ8QYU9_FUSEQ|nr:hypothetical protein NW768_010972 [Fusarium equiseti]